MRKMKMKKKILEKVNEKLREDCQDPQMGFGERYFIELVEFIIKEARKNGKN